MPVWVSCRICSEMHDKHEWPEECTRQAKVRASEHRSDIYDGKMVERGHWRIDRATGEFITIDEWARRYPDTASGLTIMKDLEPYRNVYGEYVGGRKQHADFLRARGVIEVGNEKIPDKKYEAPPDLKGDLRNAINKHGGL